MSSTRILRLRLLSAPLLLLALAGLLVSLPALAQLSDVKPQIDLNFDAAPAADDPLTHILLLGQEASWSGKIDGGQYVLENTANDNAVRYFQFGVTNAGGERDLGDATASVEVSGDFTGETAGAGLLYRFDPANKTYFGFVRTRTGYAILERDDKGLHGASRELSPPPTGPVTLTIRSNNGRAEFLIGDNTIGAITTPAPKGSRVGLIAVGHGKFSFDNFKVTVPGGG